jgi:F-type H+-transporting ATPase subunit b
VDEITAEREKMMGALRESLAQGRERARVVEERRLKQIESETREGAIRTGVQFTARLLARIASPEVEARVVALIAQDLALLQEEQITAFRTGRVASGCAVKVTSAFPLAEAQRSILAQQLIRIAGDNIPVEFTEDIGLLAGLRVSIGPWVLHANVKDELDFFADMVSDDRKQ